MTKPAESRLDQLSFHHDMVAPYHRPKTGWMVWGLVASISVNIAVLAFMVLQLQDGVVWLEVESSGPLVSSHFSQSESLKEQIIALSTKSDDELVRALEDETSAANGYTVQELALALLRFRGYQVEDPLRPLGAWPQPLSTFTWVEADGRTASLPLFSTVGPREIQAVKSFMQESAVPLTPEGIVRRLQAGQTSDAMKAALLRTDEWAIVARLFSPMNETEMLGLSQEIGPEAFSRIVSWGKMHADGKDLGPILLSLFTQAPSPKVAELLASRCADMVVLQASDELVVQLFSTLPSQNEAGVRLAMRLLQGQRKLPVWHASQDYLARAASMPTLSSMDRNQVLEWLQQMARPKGASPLPAPVVKADAPLPPAGGMQSPKETVQPAKPSPRAATRQLRPYRTYVVKKGDTLWSVAKRFNVDVEKLKYLNGLKGSTLPPGKVLRIPH
jgi:LysM repeat protein